MKHHCRCSTCRARKKLPKHPLEYRKQPKCWSCGSRSWTIDAYRERVELVLIRHKLGRYQTCGQCFPYPHRKGSRGCVFEFVADSPA